MAKTNSRERLERIMRLAKNPDTRASIKTEDLRGFKGADKLRAERAKNTRLDSPFVDGSDVTNRQVARDREAALGLQFGAQDAQVRQQFADSDRRQQQAADWFAAYKADLARLQGEQQARQAATAQQLQGFGQNAQQQDTQMAQQLNTQMQQAAPPGVNFNDPEANTRAVQAADVRRRLNDSFGAMILAQDAANNQLTQDRRANVVPMTELVERRREGDRRREITDAQSELARRKGDFRTRYTEDRRDSERKGVLERLVFQAETADKVADNRRQDAQLRSQKFERVEQRKLARRREDRQDAAARRAAEKDRYQRETRTGPYKPAVAPDNETPAQRRARREKAEKTRTSITTARDVANGMLRQTVEVDGKKRRPTEQEVRAALLEKYKDNVIVNAAMELRKRGRLNPGTADRLRKRGIGVPKDWTKPMGPQKTGAMDVAGKALGGLEKAIR